MDDLETFAASLDRYRTMTGRPMVASLPLERDPLRRFAQAVMDPDPTYFDGDFAERSKFGGIVAPPLYPVHAFRPPAGGEDPLDLVRADPDADGSGGSDGVFFGLEPIVSPFKRLLNGGNEIEFYRCLAIGETCVATARYADIQLKDGKSGPMLLVSIETTFTTDAGDLLLINKQTLIWR